MKIIARNFKTTRFNFCFWQWAMIKHVDDIGSGGQG
ncbi:MAG: hypothetical protein JWO32_1490 [Bacteroidetes bacterium]|nr:hypothetical protein [Bacteroidota bacterium]